MKSITQVTSTALLSFGVSEVTTVEWLQISSLVASLIFSMYKLYLESKDRK